MQIFHPKHKKIIISGSWEDLQVKITRKDGDQANFFEGI
jgi:hypothetical protein